MVYFDFDGTLVSVWKRYYAVFSHLINANGLQIEEYIKWKKKLKQDSKVAGKLGYLLPEDYFEQKKILLESPEYLALDEPIVPADMICDYFAHNLCKIITNRRNKETFHWQLKFLGMTDLLDQTIVLHPDMGQSKKAYLQQNEHGPFTIIGDSPAEWEVQNLPNAQVILVQSGLYHIQDCTKGANCCIIQDVSRYFA